MYQAFYNPISRTLMAGFFVLACSISSASPTHNQAATAMRGTKPASRYAQLQQFLKDMCSYTRDNCAILHQVVRHPTQVAAFSASSPWLVRQILQPMAIAPKDKPLNILEIGFGYGTVTDQIIPLMGSDDRLDAVELNAEWCEQVKARYLHKNHDNVHFYSGGFETWQSEIDEPACYDFIICTLPFTRLPKTLVKQCLQKINTLLKPGGVFVYITLVGARSMGTISHTCSKESATYKEKMHLLDTWSSENFDRRVRATVLLNLTPAYVHCLHKNADVQLV